MVAGGNGIPYRSRSSSRDSVSLCPECGTGLGASEGGDQGATITADESAAVEDIPEETSADEASGFDLKHAAVAVLVVLVPAFGLYVMTGLAFYNPLPAVLLVGLIAFSNLLHQRPRPKAMVSGALFWLAVETSLTPLALDLHVQFCLARGTDRCGASRCCNRWALSRRRSFCRPCPARDRILSSIPTSRRRRVTDPLFAGSFFTPSRRGRSTAARTVRSPRRAVRRSARGRPSRSCSYGLRVSSPSSSSLSAPHTPDTRRQTAPACWSVRAPMG